MPNKIIYWLLIAALPFSMPLAQPGGGGRPSIDDQITRFTEKLALTAEQATLIKALLTEMQEQMEASRAGTGSKSGPPSRDDMEKMLAQRNAMEEKIKVNLTDEQVKIYEKMQAERHKGPPLGGKPHNR